MSAAFRGVLLALLVALWLGAIVALADEPSELDAMRATAAAARDIEREGAFLCGSAPWDRPQNERRDASVETYFIASHEQVAP